MKGPEGPMGLTGLPGLSGKIGDQGMENNEVELLFISNEFLKIRCERRNR